MSETTSPALPKVDRKPQTGLFLVGELRLVKSRPNSEYADVYILPDGVVNAIRLNLRQDNEFVAQLRNAVGSVVTLRLTQPRALLSRAGKPFLGGFFILGVEVH